MSVSSLLASGSNEINTAYLWTSGSVTLNGTTPVAVAVPGIAAADNVVFTRLTTASDNGVALVITAGTGFTVVSNAADTGVLRWTLLRA